MSAAEQKPASAPAVFLAAQAALWAFCVLCELIARGLGYQYPFLQPLTNEYDFPDLLHLECRFRAFHTPAFFAPSECFPFTYPATMAPPYVVAFSLGDWFGDALKWFIALVTVVAVAAAVLFRRALIRAGMTRGAATLVAVLLVALSYPLAFELRQANFEIIVWAVVASAVFCLVRDRPYAAAALIGIAGAMKYFPLIYLGVFLSRKQFKPVAVALAVAAAYTLLSVWFVSPHSLAVGLHGTLDGLAAFRGMFMVIRMANTGFDHSLFTFVKIASKSPFSLRIAVALSYYLPTLAALGLAAYLFRIRFLPLVNQVVCFCVASILLPPVSYDYTLMHLYVPLGLLLLVALAKGERWQEVPGLLPMLLCLALLCSPTTEVIWRGYTYGAQVKAAVMLLLFGLALRFPLLLGDKGAVDGPDQRLG